MSPIRGGLPSFEGTSTLARVGGGSKEPAGRNIVMSRAGGQLTVLLPGSWLQGSRAAE